MKYDFVNELGYLGLAVRLKRLSDAMVHSGRQMYKELGLDIEPNWFLIFLLLKKYEKLSVTEIAAKLHFSHPSVITMVGKMEKAGYLHSSLDKLDSRKKLFTLSLKAEENLPRFEEVWQAGTEGVKKLFSEDNNFLNTLEALEVQYSQKDFKERTLNELGNE
ncbi:MarR family winged helix-turn-helix transcriptional regulator [Ekhidna sp.]|uniref:MarR family winged helix-turn-helix transcriptional regulator n=1 Tax=Ekhidna sp. TaxID=2608089 RepID=UPI003514265B